MPNLSRAVETIRAGYGIQPARRCRFLKQLALLASIVVAACVSAGTGFAQPVEYVKVCSAPGTGFFFIPGTDKCGYATNLPYVYDTAFGTYSTQPGTQSTAYGANAFANGTGSVAIGDHAFSGGDPFSGSPGASNGIDGQTPNSAYSNANTTAVGQGARAGATAAGQDNATAVGNGALANAANASAFGQGAQANASNSVAIGFGSVANVANTVSVGSAGNERRIVNVASATIATGSTDAVNGGQLFTANQRVAAAFGGGAGLDINGQLTAPSYTIQSVVYNNAGSAFGALDTALSSIVGGSTYVRVNSSGPVANASGTDAIALGGNAQATQSGSIAVGLNSSSTGANSIAIGTGATATGSVAVGAGASAANGGAAYGDGAVATGSLSTAVGPNASATAANAVAIGSGSTNTVANTVSFGSAGNERRLTNVAAGINPTDAVNVGQLQSVAAGFQSQLGGLQSQINDTRWEARGGVALALAASGLRYDDRPGKLSLAGAFGNFKGESGLALGLGYAATDRLRFNASVSGVPSQSSVGGTVSGSITLN
ncbi:YadA-like family protein [Bradyrhizobium sediminis]|uniref:Porin n=1 Tax=Bradyrhizobium sediminis TaxID=2840469 RepID=A0A975P1W6_9BRAD|nr:YadA-like family protein [Bradyrhizobium sediminis]QWG25402.1 YadA-like family protein [Bradyrhizobium sediminis]